METENVINDLVKDLRPVQPIRPFGVRMGMWILMAGGVALAVVLTVGVNRDLELALRSTRLVLDVGSVFVLAVTAGWAALCLSVPGEGRERVHKYLPMSLLGFWIVFSLVQMGSAFWHTGLEALIPDPHIACALLTAGAGGLLTIPLGILIRAAAPLDPRWCGALAGLAAGSAAMVGVEFICVYERPAHFAAYHVLPVTLFTAAGALTGPLFLRQGKRAA